MKDLDVSVVIVSWNGREHLLRCLAALRDRPQGVTFQVHVIDNASADGTADAVAQAFPDTVVVRNAYNRGFARAVNQGLRAARGRHLVLLNPDTLPGAGLLRALADHLDRAPDVGLCGVQLLHEDGSKQNSIDNDPTLLAEALNKSLLRRIFPERFPSKRQAFAGPTDVPTVIGACMAVRRAALADAGRLDEGYFLFLEETDWCLAMRRAGWRVVHLPGVELVHLQGKSKDAAPTRARIEYLRSLFRYYRKNRGTGAWLAVRAIRLIRSTVDVVSALAACVFTMFGNPRLRERLRTVASVTAWQLLGCPDAMGLQPREWREERPERGPELNAAALADLDALAQREGVEVLKDVRIKRLLRMKDARGTWRVKVYRDRGWWGSVRAALFGTRAEREDRCAREAAMRGIPTLIPTGVWVRRDGLLPRDSAVAHRELSNVVALDAFLHEERVPARRRAAIAAYGRYARRTHDAGVHQDDFDPNNALLEWVNGQPRLILIDHERVTLRPPLTDRERIWNLAKLHRFAQVSWAERARFLKAYVGRGLPGGASWRELAARVLADHRKVRARDFTRAARSAFREDRAVLRYARPNGLFLSERNWRAQIDPTYAGLLEAEIVIEDPHWGMVRHTEGFDLPGRAGRLRILTKHYRSFGSLREVWSTGRAALRVAAPVVRPVDYDDDLAERWSNIWLLESPPGQSWTRTVRGAAPADRPALFAALGLALGRLEACGLGIPWRTCGAALIPDLGLARAYPSHRGSLVRLLPWDTFVLARRGPWPAPREAWVELVRAWIEACDYRVGAAAEERAALALGFARGAGVPVRERAAFRISSRT